jgi:hypothetical protein
MQISWPGSGAAPAGAVAGLKNTFRPADVPTVARAVEVILTSPTQ